MGSGGVKDDTEGAEVMDSGGGARVVGLGAVEEVSGCVSGISVDEGFGMICARSNNQW